ncbi:ral GTPase-activating protein subunit alpha-1-like isoform X2 [Gigantopelta aegis]|uniref:ral GTPase-activating protein subunit alpha-1-like isoform X2 n=1 Tax=Gigantopelta aegis TaxID=1735272 RepID=UPI001B8876B2|nr:ral GTPase-activating protein subunit alpha-1-like isoform X2 [Gigantopelta aegis]
MSSALSMFRKTTSHGDLKRSAQKVADPKKDSVTRLKHLRSVLDNYDTLEAKKFFQENYSHIYYIFYDNFGVVEHELKQRVNKAHREELDGVLHIFEKILFLLPELIHKRWMFHSIGRVMKKLLHTSNSIKLRREGMKLFIVWYQILQENASEECHQIFWQLVPGLGEGLHQNILSQKATSTADTGVGIIAAGEITAILQGFGEKLPENLTKYFFDALLRVMVSEVVKIEWVNREMKEASFVFLFNRFKTSYLYWILPSFKIRDIYEPVLELPRKRTRQEVAPSDQSENTSGCRDSFIRWLANFTISAKKMESQRAVYSSGVMESPLTNREDVPDGLDTKCTLSDMAAGPGEKDISSANRSAEDHSHSEYAIVRTVLYSTRENVNIIHECFRQALLFSFENSGAMKKVVGVYKEWFQHDERRPIFMMEPGNTGGVCECDSLSGTPEYHHGSLSDIVEEDVSSDDSVSAGFAMKPHQLNVTDGGEKPKYIRNASYLGAVEELADHGHVNQADVKAGMQKVLQVFITNAGNIFLLDAANSHELNEQVDLCKRVLNIYRHIVMNVQMVQKTWEQLLLVLLRITSGVLQTQQASHKQQALGRNLAQAIFQTIIVTWIKANLNVFICSNLWDELLNVLSSLTSWIELIKEWSKTMETLTRVLARQVYGLDLMDLPLVRLSEQKEKRRRGQSFYNSGRSTDDQKFTDDWSQGQGKADIPSKSSTTNSANQDANFERGKFKSDGAGGGRSRPDLHKQRSLSGEPSPAHSRSESNVTDVLVRSSSEGTIADPKELIEKLRGVNLNREPNRSADIPACGAADAIDSISGASAAVEDHEVAELTTTCTAELASASGINPDGGAQSEMDNISLDKSDSDMVVKCSHTPSPTSVHSPNGSRSPSPVAELILDQPRNDSLTPDRDSLHIDMVEGSNEAIITRADSTQEYRSVMAGGTLSGWTPDVAVVLWKRMLGCLGDVNNIEDPVIHETVFDYLGDLLAILIRLRENLGVTQDNTSTPPPPELIPPQQIFGSWVFKCLTLSQKYKNGKLKAYQLLCQMFVRRHDVQPSKDVLSQFIYVLHQGLISVDQDVVNVLVRHCGTKPFSLALPGSSLLILDFIHAAGTVISSPDAKVPPREEAVSVLGSLLCFSNHFNKLPVLQPNTMDMTQLSSKDLKEHIINLLLKAGKREPAGLARCIAVSSVGIFLYEELSHDTSHPKIKESVHVLLASLRCGYRKSAKVASDMLTLLCDHCSKLMKYYPSLPKTIVEFIAQTISTLLNHENLGSDEEKRLIVDMMFCMVEWCMKMPITLLMESTVEDRSCLYKVFRILHSSVTGHSASSLTRSSKSLADFMQDLEGDMCDSPGGSPRQSSHESGVEMVDEPKDPVFETPRKPETDIVKLAARTLMTHLVNHLCHFPMGSGAVRLNSNTQEHHDLPNFSEDELKSDIFSAHNIQFFVMNHRSLISFIELPAMDAPGGGVTAGLSTARTVCRVVIRDLCGKFCWESSVLYSPPWYKKGSSLCNAKTLLGMRSEVELEPLVITEESDTSLPAPAQSRPASELPLYETITENDDNLDHLLRYIAHTSPECVLSVGSPLNIPAQLPEKMCVNAESVMTEMVTQQKVAEIDYYSIHKNDVSLLAKPQMPMEIHDPVSPFQMCRLVLDQLGLLSWEKRVHFDLLKKSDKLVRELKNLDSQMCRETHKIAVIYVAAGQEDRSSILSNSGASKPFEDFVAGLGWEVDLGSHQGFRGGLQANKTTGSTAPYYATSTYEAVFHVSTRIPSGSDESRNIKTRHLGNDEVHIVWSEHSRDYRRGIIPTEFGDVLIVIYPLPNGLYRIQIDRKPEVPYFGPLFDGAILDRLVLPGLVRATAINASRVKRSSMPFYHSFYEERAKCLETIIQQHTEQTTFEEFAANVFAPVLPPNSTIVDTPPVSEITVNTIPTELSGIDQTDHMSPPTLRHSRASESTLQDGHTDSRFIRTARRLSMKSRKSSAR